MHESALQLLLLFASLLLVPRLSHGSIAASSSNPERTTSAAQFLPEIPRGTRRQTIETFGRHVPFIGSLVKSHRKRNEEVDEDDG